MSRGRYSGSVELDCYFTMMIEGGYLSMEDFTIDFIHTHSYEDYDIDLDSDDFDWLSDMYDEFLKEAKKVLAENGIEITEDTYGYADFDMTIEADFKGYWDDGDYWNPPEGNLEIGENNFSYDIVFTGIEYDEEV